MKYDFITKVNRKHQGSIKWIEMYSKNPNVSEGVIPLSVADMEFKNAPEIIDGLKKYLDENVLGYVMANDEYKQAVCDWMKKRHDFTIEKDWIINTSGVVPAIFHSVNAFTEKGDGVVVMTPVYYPFFKAIKEQGRVIVECPLIEKDGEYIIDYQLFDKLTKDAKNKTLLFCSPHNPVGRVWRKEELKKLGEIILKNNVLVLSDEIHFDLIMSEAKHTVFQTLSEELSQQIITFTAASKTFNLAGMGVSNTIIKNKDLRAKFAKEIGNTFSMPVFPLGYKATEIAYRNCEQWLEECLEVIETNRDILVNFFKEKYPDIKVFKNEGTYLTWVDFRSLNLDKLELEKFMINEAQLFLDEGYIFGTNGEGFERFNLAVPVQVLRESLDRLDKALQKLK